MTRRVIPSVFHERCHIQRCGERDRMFQLFAFHSGEVIYETQQREMQNWRQPFQLSITRSILKALTLGT